MAGGFPHLHARQFKTPVQHRSEAFVCHNMSKPSKVSDCTYANSPILCVVQHYLHIDRTAMPPRGITRHLRPQCTILRTLCLHTKKPLTHSTGYGSRELFLMHCGVQPTLFCAAVSKCSMLLAWSPSASYTQNCKCISVGTSGMLGPTAKIRPRQPTLLFRFVGLHVPCTSPCSRMRCLYAHGLPCALCGIVRYDAHKIYGAKRLIWAHSV